MHCLTLIVLFFSLASAKTVRVHIENLTGEAIQAGLICQNHGKDKRCKAFGEILPGNTSDEYLEAVIYTSDEYLENDGGTPHDEWQAFVRGNDSVHATTERPICDLQEIDEGEARMVVHDYSFVLVRNSWNCTLATFP